MVFTDSCSCMQLGGERYAGFYEMMRQDKDAYGREKTTKQTNVATIQGLFFSGRGWPGARAPTRG